MKWKPSAKDDVASRLPPPRDRPKIRGRVEIIMLIYKIDIRSEASRGIVTSSFHRVCIPASILIKAAADSIIL